MSDPAVDVFNASNGIQDNGSPRPWAFVRVRARTVLGDVLKKPPFNRLINGKPVAATTSQYDHDIGTAEQTSWRYIDSQGTVWDLKDWMITFIELMVASQPQAVADARKRAAVLRPWPTGFPGKPDFE